MVKDAKILILGITFKENCPDIRNTKVVDIYNTLAEYTKNITIYDPWANPEQVKHEYGIDINCQLSTVNCQLYDVCIAAVAHKEFEELDILSLLNEKHVVYDVKSMLDRRIVDGRL